jgi:hypothetical protein
LVKNSALSHSGEGYWLKTFLINFSQFLKIRKFVNLKIHIDWCRIINQYKLNQQDINSPKPDPPVIHKNSNSNAKNQQILIKSSTTSATNYLFLSARNPEKHNCRQKRKNKVIVEIIEPITNFYLTWNEKKSRNSKFFATLTSRVILIWRNRVIISLFNSAIVQCLSSAWHFR